MWHQNVKGRGSCSSFALYNVWFSGNLLNTSRNLWTEASFSKILVTSWLKISGRIVILTLHPPTYEIFTMLSRILLISAGRTMFSGRRRDMLQYFTLVDYPCPPFKNPSDYYREHRRLVRQNRVKNILSSGPRDVGRSVRGGDAGIVAENRTTGRVVQAETGTDERPGTTLLAPPDRQEQQLRDPGLRFVYVSRFELANTNCVIHLCKSLQ